MARGRGARPSHMPIAKRGANRAVIPADLRGIMKIVGSAVSAGWADRWQEFHAELRRARSGQAQMQNRSPEQADEQKETKVTKRNEQFDGELGRLNEAGG